MCVLKAVLGMSSSVIRIWWYPLCKSKELNAFDPCT